MLWPAKQSESKRAPGSAGLGVPGVGPPAAAVPPQGGTWGSAGRAAPAASPGSHGQPSTPGALPLLPALGVPPPPDRTVRRVAGAVLAAGRVRAAPRLFCALCDVALVTLASFPSHGFSKSPAAPPPPCALALAARPRPAGNALPARTRDVTLGSAVCFWGREASPGRTGWPGSRSCLGPALALPWPHGWVPSCPAAESGLCPSRVWGIRQRGASGPGGAVTPPLLARWAPRATQRGAGRAVARKGASCREEAWRGQDRAGRLLGGRGGTAGVAAPSSGQGVAGSSRSGLGCDSPAQAVPAELPI